MTKLKILGWIYVAVCSAALLIGTVLCVGIVLSSDPAHAKTIAVIGPIFLALAVVYLVPGFVGGVGLLFAQRWARVVIGIESAMFLLLFPVGTVIGAFGLWVLLNDDTPPAPVRVLEQPMASGAPERPQAAGSGVGGLLLAIAGVGSGFGVAIGTGFWISGDATPVEISSIYPGSILVFVLVMAIAVVHVVRSLRFGAVARGVGRWFSGEEARLARERRQREEERRLRLAELARDPVKRKYVVLIERGEEWSDAQIAYNEDLQRVATCLHLQPIERSMRATGIQVRLEIAPNVRASCCVDAAELQRRFEPPEWVTYSEPARYDRSLLDPPDALIACTACTSRIDVLHRLRAAADTPVFPLAPAE